MGIPVPAGLTPEEVDDCDRFSLLVFGTLLFDREPSHNGRHGYGCEFCHSVLAELEQAARPVRQPWEAREAA
jgi:hypothetical protein